MAKEIRKTDDDKEIGTVETTRKSTDAKNGKEIDWVKIFKGIGPCC